ncbi:uncharacterized protein LOC127259779 [Andrographis paniculata]|uniref:uncharacterized protein LOC127259779 n=1 Tax=Andrographis paniculata TaxID=175694 RepID=UPI0021E6D8FE|nr:uncharacterized protein LOC127259779 [Andrographis paniculata]
MAKSMRSKREKRLRAIRREMVEPIYEKKEAAKQTALEAALAAPKLPVKPSPFAAMETADEAAGSLPKTDGMDVEMADGSQHARLLKPMGKKMKKKIKIARRKGHGKGKIRKKHNV